MTRVIELLANACCRIFAPAECQKDATEKTMKSFIAELKSQKAQKKKIWSSSKKTFEEEFLDKIGPGTHNIESVVVEIEKTWIGWKDRPQKFEKARVLFSQL
jgi:hypothetical protein